MLRRTMVCRRHDLGLIHRQHIKRPGNTQTEANLPGPTVSFDLREFS